MIDFHPERRPTSVPFYLLSRSCSRKKITKKRKEEPKLLKDKSRFSFYLSCVTGCPWVQDAAVVRSLRSALKTIRSRVSRRVRVAGGAHTRCAGSGRGIVYRTAAAARRRARTLRRAGTIIATALGRSHPVEANSAATANIAEYLFMEKTPFPLTRIVNADQEHAVPPAVWRCPPPSSQACVRRDGRSVCHRRRDRRAR